MSRTKKRFVWINIVLAAIFAAFIVVSLIGAIAPKVYAQEGQAVVQEQAGGQGAARQVGDAAMGDAFLSAAIVVGLSCLAAGIAVGMTGSAAIGAVAERPELMGRTVIFVGLAEGIAIYGLIIAIMILGKV